MSQNNPLRVSNSKFFIAKESKRWALQALIQRFQEQRVKDVVIERSICASCMEAIDLTRAINDFWWAEVSEDAEGNINGIKFKEIDSSLSIAQDFVLDLLLRTLAPFVKSGSFIEVEGDPYWTGTFRWTFNRRRPAQIKRSWK